MRTVRWNRELGRQRERRSLEYHVLSPLRHSPRLKPRSLDERLALALTARAAVESASVVQFLGARRWRLVRAPAQRGEG